MRTIGFDVETTKIPKHLPWIDGSYLVSAHFAEQTGAFEGVLFNHPSNSSPLRDSLDKTAEYVMSCDRIVGHNVRFDLHWLRAVGLNPECKFWCTQVVDYIINGQQPIGYSLADTSKRYRIAEKKDIVKTYWDAGYETDEVPASILLNYGNQDAINTLAIFQRQVPIVRAKGLERVVALSMDLLPILADLEANGMRFDMPRALAIIKEYQDKSAEIERRLFELLGVEFNINSDEQLSAALYGGTIKRVSKVVRKNFYYTCLNCKANYNSPFEDAACPKCSSKLHKLRETKDKTYNELTEEKITGLFKPKEGTEAQKEGVYKVNKKIIPYLPAKSKAQKEVKELLIERSAVAKVIETLTSEDDSKGLIHKVDSSGIIHPKYNQSVTVTARLSSSDPNGQNFPRKGTSPIKQVFIPREDGWLIGSGDAAQLEWRVAIYLSQDPVGMREIINNEDYHLNNALEYFGDAKYRTIAKIFGFRLLYGGGPKAFAADPAMPKYSEKQWVEIVKNYYKKYAGLKQWQNDNIAKVYRDGLLRTPAGRILNFPKVQMYDGSMGYSSTSIKNWIVQSFATGDIIPLAMVVANEKRKRMKLSSLMICQVHDSIVWDIKPGELDAVAKLNVGTFRELPSIMKSYWGIDFNIPMDGDFECGFNYGDLKKYDFAA